MALILKNEILFPQHKVVCEPEACTPEYMQEMLSSLSPDGDRVAHGHELFYMNNDGTWSVEVFTPKAYLTVGDWFSVIYNGMPVCNNKATKAEALAAAAAMRINLPEFAWNGKQGEWVLAETA
jgi:hypothetical protein